MSNGTTYYLGSQPLQYLEPSNHRGYAWFLHTLEQIEREHRISNLSTTARQTSNLKMRVDTSRGTDGAR